MDDERLQFTEEEKIVLLYVLDEVKRQYKELSEFTGLESHIDYAESSDSDLLIHAMSVLRYVLHKDIDRYKFYATVSD